MIASIQGYPVLASLHAASNLSSSFQGIYNNVQLPKIYYRYGTWQYVTVEIEIIFIN